MERTFSLETNQLRVLHLNAIPAHLRHAIEDTEALLLLIVYPSLKTLFYDNACEPHILLHLLEMASEYPEQKPPLLFDRELPLGAQGAQRLIERMA